MTLEQVAEQVQGDYKHRIILATVDGKLTELRKEVKEGTEVAFLTSADKPGFGTYKRSLILLFMRAAYLTAGRHVLEKVIVDFAISKGVYIELRGKLTVTPEFTAQVE